MRKPIAILAALLVVLMAAPGCLDQAMEPTADEETADSLPPDEPQQDPQDKISSDDDPGESSEESGSESTVVIYLPNEKGLWLQRHQVAAAAEETTVELAFDKWLDLAGFLPATEASVRINGEKAVVSFCGKIQDMDVDYEGLAVTGLVNTLTEFSGVSSVRILVDGVKQYSLAGRSYIGEPLERDESLIARDGQRPLAPSDPRRGEQFIEGVVVGLDADGRTLTIDQFDSVGCAEGRKVELADEVVIHQQLETGETEEASFGRITAGGTVGIILTSQGDARGVLITAE